MSELKETIMDTLIATVANASVAPVTNCLAIYGLGCFVYGDLKEHGYGRLLMCTQAIMPRFVATTCWIFLQTEATVIGTCFVHFLRLTDGLRLVGLLFSSPDAFVLPQARVISCQTLVEQ